VDFYRILLKVEKDGTVLVYPDWQVDNSKDLMVSGKQFYAFWDETNQMWSQDQFRLRQLIDADLFAFAKKELNEGTPHRVLTTQSFSTRMWELFNKFIKNFPDNAHPLDTNLTFANTEVKKSDFVSKRLPYSLEAGSTDAWDELLPVLYSEEERAKIEWAIGAVVSGDSKFIQKFLVFYGPPASGKSTVLNVIQKLFHGYTTTFDARALGSNGSTFATDVFKSNPLVAIQHDGDLSRIEDNSKLNSITSHEEMTMNEKYKPSYSARVNAFLFMGTNKPVQITDAKAGTIRRLIDVHPTGARIAPERYHILIEQINFELGAIAHKCMLRYREMGKHYYNGYKPIQMMYQTDEFYNFISAHFDIFKAEDGVTLRRAWTLYREYCAEVNITKLMRYSAFREELTMYFRSFEDRAKVGDEWVRSYYSGFEGIPKSTPFIPDTSYVITLDEVDALYGANSSVFDRMYADQPAQLAKPSGNPGRAWDRVTTTLSNINSTELHWVKVPEQHIVIDFDLVDEDGEKDAQRNLEEASKWPPTYTELSKGGAGIHLHYIYQGDVHELASVYDVGIEIKTLLGDASLRRKLTKCNALDIATISSGLPKKEKPVLDVKSIQSEKGLRELIERNLRKDIHPGTKPSVDFIKSILDEAYESGLSYDVSDMRPRILTFAAKSTNQASLCIKLVQAMQFVGKDNMPEVETDDDPVVFFDVEVYPNLFVVCWKYEGRPNVVRMINPEAHEIEALFKLKLVGFNNRRYDNHILYARYLGFSNLQLFDLSQKMINEKNHHAAFGEAYNLSYTDIYDFSSKKQGLKKFMIELGLNHMELDIPWDKPVPEELWDKVVEYCVNDVLGTEGTWNDRKQDFVARQILAELSGLSVNHTTQNHTARIIFGEDKNPQSRFVYTNLAEEFPGYEFRGNESFYRGEIVGEGGYVYAEPGIYENVALLDVASMHPTSIVQLNLFGPYTEHFLALKEARLAIKNGDFDRARSEDVLGGRLGKFLVGAEDDKGRSDALSYALKIVINIVYGLTSAKFENPFRDIRNKDNIVAKRGALFMVDLKHEVQARGFTVAHIKTDSIKIPNATPEIIAFVTEFGKKYGYDFEHESTYDKFALVNDAVYIARSKFVREDPEWIAVGAQFQHPYVYKTLFTHEPIEFGDLCETKNVTQGVMYLDWNGSDDVSDMVHVGRTGSFVPVAYDGAELWRVLDGKKYAVTGTKGYRWIERDIAQQREHLRELRVDMDYFERLAKNARDAIEKFGPFDEFVA
jgi:Family of unknown function (DUF5906)